MTSSLMIREMKHSDAVPFFRDIHYSHRTPGSMQFVYGLYDGEVAVGAVSFGPPSSPQVRRSVVGQADVLVLELNRLVITTPSQNAASQLVGRALKMLPPAVVVSYADGGQGHVGYVYQATNFLYAGAAKAHDSEVIVDGKRVHPRTLAARGITDPTRWAKENGYERVPIVAKHRYVTVTRKDLLTSVLWSTSRDYPKGESVRYDAPNRDRHAEAASSDASTFQVEESGSQPTPRLHSLIDAALEYLTDGFHLLALSGKRPNTRYHQEWGWENSIHGLPANPQEHAALIEVFTHRTTTGIAILVPEHVLIADVDSEQAASIFNELVPEMTPTITARTAKGFHVWYLAPGAAGTVWIGGRDGLLMKGLGGYVVVEPSLHPGDPDHVPPIEPGHHYQWINRPETGIDWLPGPMAERIATSAYFNDQRAADKADIEFKTLVVTPVAGVPWWQWQREMKWSLDGLCKAIINAPDGNQNNVIAWAALVAQEEGVPYSLAMDLLLAAAVQGGHPEDRARTTIAGVYKRRRSK